MNQNQFFNDLNRKEKVREKLGESAMRLTEEEIEKNMQIDELAFILVEGFLEIKCRESDHTLRICDRCRVPTITH